MKESAKKYSVINLNLGALRELTPSVNDLLMVFLVVDVVPLSSSKEGPKLTVLAKDQRSIQDCKGIYFPLAHKNQSQCLEENQSNQREIIRAEFIQRQHSKTSKESFATLAVLFWSLSPRHGTLFGLCIWIDDTMCLIL